MDFRKIIRGLFEATGKAEETAPGFFEQRRYFLWLSAAAATPILFPGAKASAASAAPADAKTPAASDLVEIDFKTFSDQCAALAKEAAADSNLNQTAHNFRISSLASRLVFKSIPKGKLGGYGGWDPPIELGPIRLALPLTIIQWHMAPNAVFPPHNHTPANVVSLCVEGETRVRHFDIQGDAPAYASKKSFLIRETHNDLLTPGRMSNLTMTRDNIHTFKAGKEGAWGMDINTILPGDKPFSFLEFQDTPKDSERRVFEAVWISGPA